MGKEGLDPHRGRVAAISTAPHNIYGFEAILDKRRREMKHSKRYRRTGDGVELLCGNKIIASNGFRLANFSISRCPNCDMYVETTGSSPDTDSIWEIINPPTYGWFNNN